MAELDSYIKKARESGKKENEILKTLTEAGWQERVVKEAMLRGKQKLVVPHPPLESEDRRINHSSIWDVFEHILLFISLYVMATSIALILHYYVDKYIPAVSSVQSGSYLYTDSVDTYKKDLMLGSTAALICSLPLFSYFFLSIAKRSLINKSIRALKGRKILIYITLVTTFIIMLSNIITFVYELLKTEISLNSTLHLIITLAICGLIFIYYLQQVKEDRKINA